VLAGVPFDEVEGFEDGVVEASGADREVVQGEEAADEQGEPPPFLFPRHAGLPGASGGSEPRAGSSERAFVIS